jgi:hypothetical protein
MGIGIFMLQRCELGGTSFARFRQLAWSRYLLAGVRLTGLQPERHKKIPPPKLGGGNTLGSTGNLLANDAGIILRQIEASLPLLL